MGSSWEDFALEQVLRQIRPTQAYFRGRPDAVQATLAPGVEV